MEIRFGGAVTKDEYLQFVKLTSHKIRSHTSFTVDMWLLLVLTGSLLVLSGGWLAFFGSQIWGLYLFVAGLFVVIVGVRLRESTEKFWQENEIFRVRREGVITEDGIESSTPTGFSRLKWEDFSGFGEYMNVFVLYQGTALGTVYSQRFFQSEEDWQQFRTFAMQKLKRTHQVKLDRAAQWKGNSKPKWVVWLLLIVAIIAMLIGGFRNQ